MLRNVQQYNSEGNELFFLLHININHTYRDYCGYLWVKIIKINTSTGIEKQAATPLRAPSSLGRKPIDLWHIFPHTSRQEIRLLEAATFM